MSSIIKTIYTLLILMNMGIAVSAQSHQLEISSLMDFYYKNGAFSGMVLVVGNGKIIYDKAFGFANLKTKEPLITNSAFYLASVSKQFTAMAIMMLEEQGSLSYHDKLSKYFPEFPEYANQVTIKHLLTHTSGMVDYYDSGYFKPGFTNDDVLSAMLKQPSLEFTPGEKYAYSNSAYVILSMIVEKVSGMSFREFMEKNILNPLQMNSTIVFDQSNPEIKNRTTGFNLVGDIDDYNAFTTGGGGMYSTTGDLYLWDQALYTDKLIPQASLNEAFTPTVLNDGTVSNYGYGWMIEYNDQDKSVFHTGGLSGFRTNIYRELSKHNTVILFTNYGSAEVLKSISRSIQAILHDSPVATPWLPASLKLFKLSEDKPIEKVIDTYHDLVKNRNDEFDLSEKQLNSLGYMLLKKKREQDAMAIFRLNLELHPALINPQKEDE